MDGSDHRFKCCSWRDWSIAQHDCKDKHAQAHIEKDHQPISLTHFKTLRIHTQECWNWLWLALPLVNPSGAGLPPFLSFSNNVGLTCTLLRALGSLQQIKDNLHLIHVVVFIPLCYSPGLLLLGTVHCQWKVTSNWVSQRINWHFNF